MLFHRIYRCQYRITCFIKDSWGDLLSIKLCYFRILNDLFILKVSNPQVTLAINYYNAVWVGLTVKAYLTDVGARSKRHLKQGHHILQTHFIRTTLEKWYEKLYCWEYQNIIANLNYYSLAYLSLQVFLYKNILN